MHNEELENAIMYDIGTGIFAPGEAASRKMFFSLRGSKLSDAKIEFLDKLMYEYKVFTSFIYLKLEGAYSIAYGMVNDISRWKALFRS